ncbi:MAG: MBL fold metallo-hydrolase, partial [Cyclobacteriaceae bacterium]|nr:MBL fold metallo-hydrolase [Cyclobacteriaceae bacterium]
CIEILKGDQLLIVDAGTGLLTLSPEKIATRKRFDILLTHLHFDHVQGLGFFNPLFNPLCEVHIYGPAGSSGSLQNRLKRYLSPPLFPVHFRDLPCQIHLHEVSHSSFEIGKLRINSNYILHPGPTVGYRISDGNHVLSYFPDHEPVLDRNGWKVGDEWISGMGLARSADLLIHDSQYTSDEYESRVGWGHSSIEVAIKFAIRARVKKLLLFHHDPNHQDTDLEKSFNDHLRDKTYDFQIELAREGMVIDLDGG